MRNIDVLFQGILFSVDYECDNDACYAISAMFNDNEWIDAFTEVGMSGLNKALIKALEDYAIECETENKLSDRGKN